jgi:hypothetical protein
MAMQNPARKFSLLSGHRNSIYPELQDFRMQPITMVCCISHSLLL